MVDRVTELGRRLSAENLDAAFLVKPHNVFYLSGYSSVCSGMVVFPRAEPIFCTLWLDAPEAARFCRLPKVSSYVFPKDRLMSRMAKLARDVSPEPRRIGVEKDFMLVSDFEVLGTAFPNAEFVHVTPLVDRMRAIKTPEEIDHMKKSASIAVTAMEAVLGAVKAGVTEIEVAAEAEYAMRKLGSERPAFGTFVASGERTLLAHPHATRRVMHAGDPVVIDLGATWNGYASDICRTTFVGDPTDEQRRHLRLVARAQQAAASQLKPGVVAGAVYEAAREVFGEARMSSLLPDDIGYGVGLRQSEFYPIIEKGSATVLAENMVVALLQTTGYNKSVGGLRVEDTFWITANGYEKLTHHDQVLW